MAANDSRWTLLLPPGWATIPTEPEKAKAAIRQITDRMMANQHRDELVQTRVEVEKLLHEQVTTARLAGAAALHLLVQPIRDVPVTASVVVSEITLGPGEELLDAVRQVLGEAAGVVENESVAVAGLEGLRRRRRERTTPMADAPDFEVWETHVDYLLAIGPDDFLLLNYATITDEVADELVVLFDAITETLHLRGD